MFAVKLKPVAMERIWGGDALKSTFGEATDNPVGEYWVVSGHPNGMSVVADGPLQGKTLQQLTEEYSGSFLGQSPQGRFPLLIKFLEAHTDLSVQIHPDDAYAKTHEGDFGKTEAWYILDAKAKGKVNYGHAFPSRSAYEQAVSKGNLRDFLTYRDVQKGDLVFVPARTLHALLGGTTVLEIQQTSDVTYRVYDWDRVDAEGKSRELHVDKAADVLTYDARPADMPSAVLKNDEKIEMTRVATCEYFTIDVAQVHAAHSFELGRYGNPDAIIVVEGQGRLHMSDDGDTSLMGLKAGDAVLIPATASSYTITPTGTMTVVRTFY